MLQARSLRGNYLQYCKELGFLLLGWLNTSIPLFGCPIKRPTRPAPSIMCEMCAAAQEISWGIITKPQMTTPHTPLMLLGCSLRDWWILYGDLELLSPRQFRFLHFNHGRVSMSMLNLSVIVWVRSGFRARMPKFILFISIHTFTGPYRT